MMWRSRHAKVLAALFGLLLIAGLGVAWYMRSGARPMDDVPAVSEPYRATLVGMYVCLPHADTAGPQTLECALGLQSEEGAYYALDFNASSILPSSVPTGSRVTVSGMVTPVENLSTDHWRKYPIEGILSVTDTFSK